MLSKFQVFCGPFIKNWTTIKSSVLTNTSSGSGANCGEMLFKSFKSFIDSIEKMAKHTLKILRCNTARFLKYVWPLINMNERVKKEKRSAE